MCIFNYFNSKQNDDDTSLLSTINYYNLFYEMLNTKTIKEDDEEILNIVSNSFKTFDELKENIKRISKLGKVNGEKKIDLYNSVMNNDENKTIEKIFLFYRKKELKEFMKSFESFNLIFPNSETFIKDCELLTSKLRETKVLPYFDEIREIICKWDERLLTEKHIL